MTGHSKEYYISFEEFEFRCRKIAARILKNKNIKSLYPIPRGGLAIGLRLSHLTGLPITGNPNPKTTCIIDDCLDSGSTRKAFKNFPYYEVLVDKKKEKINEWLVFWWEVKYDESV